MITFQVTLDPEELQMLLDLEGTLALAYSMDSCIEDALLTGIITQIRKQTEKEDGQ